MTTSDSLKAALYTALFTFVALFGLSLAGWLNDVWHWASSNDHAVLFPDPAVVWKAAVSAVIAACSGLVNFAVRFAQGHLGAGELPTYVKSPKG